MVLRGKAMTAILRRRFAVGTVTLLRPYPSSATLFAMAADALVNGRDADAARLTVEADRALLWELSCSCTHRAVTEILRKAGRA